MTRLGCYRHRTPQVGFELLDGLARLHGVVVRKRVTRNLLTGSARYLCNQAWSKMKGIVSLPRSKRFLIRIQPAVPVFGPPGGLERFNFCSRLRKQKTDGGPRSVNGELLE